MIFGVFAVSRSLKHALLSASFNIFGVSNDVSEMSQRRLRDVRRRLSVSYPVGSTVGFETPKTSKTPIFKLLSNIIPIESIYPLVTPRFLSARLAHNVVTVLDVILGVIIFQPQVEALTFQRSHAVQTAPVAIGGV